jgi:uncharacterized protein YjbK
MNEKKIQFVGTGNTNNRIGTTQLNQNELVTITGILTSRIETKQDRTARHNYHYGFFKIEGYELEIPVVFKDQKEDEYYKPTLTKGSQVQLTGT